MTEIVDFGISRFGKRDEGLIDLCQEAAEHIVSRHGDAIDYIICSNAYSGEYAGISGINHLVASRLSLDTTPSVRIDNTAGSGGTSILFAQALIDSGKAHNVLVVGAEKMSGVSTKQSSRIIASILNSEERKSGATLPAFAAFMAKRYMEKFGASRESLAMVAVKNHFNALSNPAAHHQKAVTLEAVLGSRIVADPLRLYEFCPISDGAAAILVAGDKTAASFDHKRVRIASTNQAFSGSSVSTRDPFLTIDCVRKAANGAFQSAGLSPKDVDVAELHDMATILEIVESEDVGFFKKGEGWRAVMEADTGIGGAFPLNTSGGLNSRGHPIGATGIAQAGEIYLQLSGNAGGRQVKNASTGFSLNMSGFGNSASAITYEAI